MPVAFGAANPDVCSLLSARGGLGASLGLGASCFSGFSARGTVFRDRGAIFGALGSVFGARGSSFVRGSGSWSPGLGLLSARGGTTLLESGLEGLAA